MKSRFLLYHVLFVSLAVVVTALCLVGVPRFVTIAGAASLITFFGFIVYQWMMYVHSLAGPAAKKSFSIGLDVSFRVLDEVKQFQDMLIRRSSESAALIETLGSKDKCVEYDLSDPVGQALHKVRQVMMRMKAEDDQRAWISRSLAQFAEILRNKVDMKEYGYQIISNLVKQLNANQGGIYIEFGEQDDRYLELVGCYAYGKRKYNEGRIVEGQGLVGQCMVERELVYMTDIPRDYIRITSGLGDALPRCLVIAPLTYNSHFCGVVEIASFQPLQPFQLEYLRKVCENIASEVVTMRNMEHTRRLLQESEKLTTELQEREDGMKKNLEELANAQREMRVKQQELTGIINAIDSTLGTAEFDLSGRLVKYNSIFREFFKGTSSFFENFDYRTLAGKSTLSWAKVCNGELRSGDFRTKTKEGTDLWLSVTFTPVTDINRDITRVLCLVQNVTQKKLREQEFELLSLVTNNTGNSVIITDVDGKIEYVNPGFTRMTGYEFHEVVGRKPGTFLQGPLTDAETVKKLSRDIRAGVALYQEILNYNKKGETYWVSLAINPVKDEYGNITRYISIQSDITETKKKALDFHQKMQALSRSNAILEMDRNGTVIDVNENYLKILGYNKEELLGNSYAKLGSSDQVFLKLLNTIKSDGLQNGVFSRYDKAGQKHFIKLIDYPVLNLNGDLEKIIEFGVDVSNEKRFEKEAERKRAELQSYLNGINNTIASAAFDLKGKFIEGNEIFLRVMGYTVEELREKKFEYLMGEEQNVMLMWENLELGKFFSGEFKMRNKAGQFVWLNGTFNPISIEGNVPEKIMMFAQFTTQEKEKFNELNSIVSALKSILPVVEFNSEFACKTMNEKAMRIFGLTRMELRSKTLLDFIAPNFHTVWSKWKTEVLENNHTTLVIPFIMGSSLVNYEVTFSVNRNLEGRIVRVTAMLVKEVTDRVAAYVTSR
jgi:PAS domain S-box-containing protein